jgi:cation diffusion facilitator family transporter
MTETAGLLPVVQPLVVQSTAYGTTNGRSAAKLDATGRIYLYSPGNAHGQELPFAEPPSPTYRLHSISALWTSGYKHPDIIASLPSPVVREYYLAQNAQLADFRDAADNHPCLTHEDAAFLRNLPRDNGLHASAAEIAAASLAEELYIRRAVFASNSCNILLLVAQLYAFVSTKSLSFLAVFIDSFLDVVSGGVILFTYMMKRSRRDKHRYPVGRTRLEPIGVLLLACLMTAATISSIKESIGTLMAGKREASFAGLTNQPSVIVVIAIALATKSALYLYCKDPRADMGVEALAEDHRNDVLSTSSAIVTVLVAQYCAWWIDPVGGIFISCLIIRNWVSHSLEHCDKLLGKAAPRELVNVITFMACNHSPLVLAVDTVRAYHVGSGIFVEVDLVFAPTIYLWQAHDIGEALQLRIENLDGVERAFVHVEYESNHSPDMEHREI